MPLCQSPSPTNHSLRSLLGRLHLSYPEVLRKPTSVQNALSLTPSVPISTELTAAFSYVGTITSNLTSTEPAQSKRKVKGKSFAYDADKPKHLTTFVALAYPAWQGKYIDLIRRPSTRSRYAQAIEC
ncbi:hypothetical protein HOY80DRAFT_992986 [Tuber brumale]|nr:hypothetical protein HOY80DRAFT_992986 [Tuber brumale]